ncbi:MAG: hypothetical protein HRU26_03610, partial [Psychroserpens sp.]|nr:hypothetical protein [Psychroserpens sp.]
MARKKNKIHIKKSKRGTFTKAAKKRGMSVQGFARLVLANKGNYSPAMVKKANFARNAAKWKKEDGGDVGPPDFLYQEESKRVPEGWKWMNNKLQQGGQFPNALTYGELGAIPNNQIHYSPSSLTNRAGRPQQATTKRNGLFQSGGSINIDLIDKNDILHPGDSDNLSYNNNPIGISMTIKRRYKKPFKYAQGGNVAETVEEYSEGLNEGVNVFKFPSEGLKKMTMNPESGPIEYPVDYEGFTNGERTDEGTANPGEEFSVQGDTVVEYPNLSDMDFNDAFEYALQKKLPIFRWNGEEYPIQKNMKYQDGGLFSDKVTNKVKL